jgi:hypothetical protein
MGHFAAHRRGFAALRPTASNHKRRERHEKTNAKCPNFFVVFASFVVLIDCGLTAETNSLQGCENVIHPKVSWNLLWH